MKKEDVGKLQIIFSSLLIAIMVILVRLGGAIGVYNLAFFRVFVAVVFLYLFSKFLFKIKIQKFRFEGKKLLLFGILHALIIIASFFAIQLLTIASISLLESTISIWTIIFSAFILKEKIKGSTFFGIGLAFLGIVLLFSSEGKIGGTIIGFSLGVFVGIAGGLVYTLSKTFKKHGKASLVFWQNLIATIILIPLLFFNFPKFNLFNSTILLLIGILSLVSFILVYKGFGKLPAQKGGVLILLAPVFSTILAFFIFSEVPSIVKIIGGVLILSGIYISHRF